MDTLKNEPVAAGGTIAFVITESVPLLQDFGVKISDKMQTDLIRFLGVVFFIGALIVRQYVTPTKLAQDAVNTAAAALPGAPVPKL